MSTAAAHVLVPPSQLRRVSASFWSDALWRLRRDPTTMAAFAVLFILAILAIGADFLADNFFHWSFSKQDILNSYGKPNADEPAMWLGSDQLGRSQIVRLLYGARVSLFIGMFGAIVSLIIGVGLGITAGYFRGWWDDVVVWIVSTLNGIPTLYLLLIVGFLFRLDYISLAVFIGALGWTFITNQARGQTFALRERDFVTAARVIGASPMRIIVRHIFPNVLPLLIVIAMIDVAGVILAESGLSYLGFGIQPPVPSWGNMLNGATQFFTRGPWLVYPPGFCIALTVLCLYLIGDGLRDALDPRLRGAK
ncbi:MAG TPA: ABC transporter permease [Candidatus Limnocylindria bacterium]|nr:ABC transporter permease [Candidatus Limnocylindria bacterium]